MLAGLADALKRLLAHSDTLDFHLRLEYVQSSNIQP